MGFARKAAQTAGRNCIEFPRACMLDGRPDSENLQPARETRLFESENIGDSPDLSGNNKQVMVGPEGLEPPTKRL